MLTTTPAQLPASMLADWQSNDPQRMLSALRRIGVSEERIDKWCELCEREYVRLDGAYPGPANWWKTEDIGSGSMFDHAIPYLRCLFGGEFAGEWEECRTCKGAGFDFIDRYAQVDAARKCGDCRGLGVVRATVECSECEGAGTERYTDAAGGIDARPCGKCGKFANFNSLGMGRIPKPLIDPRWRTSTVLDLAREVRGNVVGETYYCKCGASHQRGPISLGGKVTCYRCLSCGEGNPAEPPNFDLLPILADAIEEVGCDNADVLEHCRSGGPHVPGECWVMLAVSNDDRHIQQTDPARRTAY